jgi:hypothetical protein
MYNWTLRPPTKQEELKAGVLFQSNSRAFTARYIRDWDQKYEEERKKKKKKCA